MNLSWLYCCRKLGIERTIRLINAHATGKVLENFVDVCVCTSFVKVAIAARGLAPYDTIRYDRRVSRISNLYWTKWALAFDSFSFFFFLFFAGYVC